MNCWVADVALVVAFAAEIVVVEVVVVVVGLEWSSKDRSVNA